MDKKDRSGKILFINSISTNSPSPWESFENFYCPLLGSLPLIKNDPSSFHYQCINIIINARKLWGVETTQIEGEYFYSEESFIPGIPRVRAINTNSYVNVGYSLEKVIAGQTIFEGCNLAFWSRVVDHPSDGGPVSLLSRLNLLVDRFEKVIGVVKDTTFGVLGTNFDFLNVPRDTDDYEILAILAIFIVWKLFYCYEDFGEPELIVCVAAAKYLLSKATELKMKDDYWLGKTTRQNNRKWRQIRSHNHKTNTIPYRESHWLPEAEKIFKDHRDKTVTYRAKLLIKKLQIEIYKDKDPERTVRKFLTKYNL